MAPALGLAAVDRCVLWRGRGPAAGETAFHLINYNQIYSVYTMQIYKKCESTVTEFRKKNPTQYLGMSLWGPAVGVQLGDKPQ